MIDITDKHKESLEIILKNEKLIKKSLEYSKVLKDLLSLSDNLSINLDVYFQTEDDFHINLSVMNGEENSIHFNVETSTQYMTEHYGDTSYYEINYLDVSNSDSVYKLFSNLDMDNIHFHTLSDSEGNTRLISLYLKNPNATSIEDRYIVIQAIEHYNKNLLDISYASKPTSF
jgi:hypothetical protein